MSETTKGEVAKQNLMLMVKECVEFYLNLTMSRTISNFANMQVTLLVFFIFFMVFQSMIKLDQMIYKSDSCYFNYILLKKYNRNITININHGEKHSSCNFWYHPKTFSNGLNPQDVANGLYGHSLHFCDWKKHEISRNTIYA